MVRIKMKCDKYENRADCNKYVEWYNDLTLFIPCSDCEETKEKLSNNKNIRRSKNKKELNDEQIEFIKNNYINGLNVNIIKNKFKDKYNFGSPQLINRILKELKLK